MEMRAEWIDIGRRARSISESGEFMDRSQTTQQGSDSIRVLLGINRLSDYERWFILDSNMHVGIAFAGVLMALEAFMFINSFALSSRPGAIEHIGIAWIMHHRLGYATQFVSAAVLLGVSLRHVLVRPCSHAVQTFALAQCLGIMLVLGTYAACVDVFRGNGLYALITQIVALTCIFVIRPAITVPLTLVSIEICFMFASYRGALSHGLIVNLSMFFAFVVIAACVRYLFAVQNAQRSEALLRQSKTDSLTRVGNVRLLREETLELVGSTATITILDLNDFKSCNDRCGHDIGDRVLIRVADGLVQSFGNEGRCYRMGGDEFIVTSTTLSYAEQNARLLSAQEFARKAIADEGICPKDMDISFAFGTITRHIATTRDLRKLERDVDRLMYVAKKSGATPPPRLLTTGSKRAFRVRNMRWIIWALRSACRIAFPTDADRCAVRGMPIRKMDAEDSSGWVLMGPRRRDTVRIAA